MGANQSPAKNPNITVGSAAIISIPGLMILRILGAMNTAV